MSQQYNYHWDQIRQTAQFLIKDQYQPCTPSRGDHIHNRSVCFWVFTHKNTQEKTSRADKTTSCQAIQILCSSCCLNRKYKRRGDPNQFVTPCQFLPIIPTKTGWGQTEGEAGGGETTGKEVKDVDSNTSADKRENRCGVREERKRRGEEKETHIGAFITVVDTTESIIRMANRLHLYSTFLVLESREELNSTCRLPGQRSNHQPSD